MSFIPPITAYRFSDASTRSNPCFQGKSTNAFDSKQPVYKAKNGTRFQISTMTAVSNPDNAETDVFVKLGNGKEYMATFCTVQHLVEVMEKFAQPDSGAKGSYFPGAGFVFLQRLTPEAIIETLTDMIDNDRLKESLLKTRASKI